MPKVVTHEQFIKSIHGINPNIEILGKYTRSRDPILCKCHVCNNIWETQANNLKRQGCPMCKQSKGEIKIEKYLQEGNIKYIKQYKIPIDVEINPSGFAYIDFYLPEYNLFIEYNGEQHYVVKKFFGGELGLLHQQKRDDAVRGYCNSNNIKLLEIPYTADNVESFISKYVK